MIHTYTIQNVKAGNKIPIYGAKKIRLQATGGSATIKLDNNLAVPSLNLFQQVPLNIPVIDGKSPSSVTVLYTSTENVNIYAYIDELGGVPYEHYWEL